MAWMLENPSAAGLFNIGSGTPRSFNDLAKATFSALDRQPVISYTPMPETLQRQIPVLYLCGYHKASAGRIQ